MIENFIAGERRRSLERGIMDQNGISEETKERIAVLGFYFSVRGFIAYVSVRVAQHRPAILTRRQSGQKLLRATGTMILLVYVKTKVI